MAKSSKKRAPSTAQQGKAQSAKASRRRASKPKASQAKASRESRRDLNAVIDEAVIAARTSVDDYAKVARRAAARLSGTSDTNAAGWLDDAARVWSIMARDAGAAWTIFTQFLDAARTQGDGSGRPPD